MLLRLPAPLTALRDRVLAIGALPTDSREDALRKQSLAAMAALIMVIAPIYVAVYLAIGRPLAALSPGLYWVLSSLALVHFARTRDYGLFRAQQVGSMLILPYTLQWSLGGFENSSAAMVWAFAGPLAALVFYGLRVALPVFGAYLALAVASALVDPALSAAAASDPMPTGLRLFFFVLNIGGVSLVTYSVLQFFVRGRERAQAEAERLLHNVLPMPIADRLRAGEQRIADDHASVTVLFADVVGFTSLVRDSEAAEVIGILDQVFTAFDELAMDHGLEKIKTIGDEYMAVAGAPQGRADHASAAAEMALDMLVAMSACASRVGRPLELRIGLHSGPAVAGVIGRRKFAYDLWGDAVNVASRMESHGVAGRIQVSQAVVDALRPTGRYLFEERGTIELKGLGEMRTFFLLGRA
jgi:adenylate cyclase